MPQVAYIDVDDTLIRSVGAKRIPIVHVIKHIKTLKADGWLLYCWSRVGKDYAQEVAEELGIASCFENFLPKPDVMIDDMPPQSWSFLQIKHPAEVKEEDNDHSPLQAG